MNDYCDLVDALRVGVMGYKQFRLNDERGEGGRRNATAKFSTWDNGPGSLDIFTGKPIEGADPYGQ